MKNWSKSRLPEWLSVEVAQDIARRYREYGCSDAPKVSAIVERTPGKNSILGPNARFRAQMGPAGDGPDVNVLWVTGDSSRSNTWRMNVPAEDILRLAEWILANEPEREAWQSWERTAEALIRKEANEAGIHLRDAQIYRIRCQIIDNRNRLLTPAEVVDIAEARRRKA